MSSCSSTPRSMPMYDVQAKSTARRSLAPGASVYGGGPPPNCACAPAVNSPLTLTARTIPSASLLRIIARRKAMVVPFAVSIIGVAVGDLDDAAVGRGNRLEEPQR